MNFKQSGLDVVREMEDQNKANKIIAEVTSLTKDIEYMKSEKIQLKDIDSTWDGYTRYEKIKKGKRFKLYVELKLIHGVSIIRNKPNHPIEYRIH